MLKNLFSIIGIVCMFLGNSISESKSQITKFSDIRTASEGTKKGISDGEINIDFQTYLEDLNLQSEIIKYFQVGEIGTFTGINFVITSNQFFKEWFLFSIASIDGEGCSREYIGSNNCSRLILGNKKNDNSWNIAISETENYFSLIQEAPDEFISENVKLFFLDSNQQKDTKDNVIYEFPWVKGSWEYRQGFHEGTAIDIGTRNADRRILSSADGIITNICKSPSGNSANVEITHIDGRKLNYFHLDKNQLSSGIEELNIVRRGQLLGTLLSGRWNYDGCGQAPNQTTAHLHWILNLVSGEELTVDGWTISYGDSAWKKGTESILPHDYPYELIPSTNDILVKQYKPFDTSLPSSWPYLVTANDNRIREITLDNQIIIESNSTGCSSAWVNVEKGNHTFIYWYELRDISVLGIPTIDIKSWPIVAPPVCAGDVNNPPPSTNPIDSEDSTFISDLSLPDGTIVSPSQSLTKTWRIENTGSTTWNSGYQLVFLRGDRMRAPASINVPTTAPGQTVDLSVPITSPSSPGSYKGYWRLRNPQGTYFGPEIFMKINVQSSSDKISIISTDPSSPSNTNLVRIYTKVEGFNNLRAIRLKIDGEVKGEFAGPEYIFSWDTSGYLAGSHNIVIEAADYTDTSWSRPEVRSLSYELLGNSSQVNMKPNKPTLTSPYNWYVYYSGNTANLCAQANGDPDGDSITGYYFDIFESPETWNSGWVSSNCVTTSALSPHDFKWQVKVRDSRGAISEWSESWNFTLINPSLSITDLSFQPQDGNSEVVKIRACTSGQGGLGITMRVDVNDANDGSANGEWHRIKELGVPCFNDVDAPIWQTLEAGGNYGDGPHLVRVEAHGLNTGWDGAAVREAIYTLPHRRPSNFQLVAPVSSTSNNHDPIFLDSPSVMFEWESGLRATNYILSIGTNPNPAGDTNPVFRQIFDANTTSFSVTFSQNYPVLYWQVRATNDKGSTDTGDQLIGIDQTQPSCTVQPMGDVSYENNFQVNWSGSDSPAGIRNYDIQYMDSARSEWLDWITGVPIDKTYELFIGQAGHDYSFRCRSTDKAGNLGTYPNSSDSTVKIDPASRPPEPWWGTAYTSKRNITLQNNMPAVNLPIGYPVSVIFNSGSTPTAAQLYDASLSANKCDDLRIIFNNSTEIHRVIRKCSPDLIEIWFRSQDSVVGGGVSTSHQLYYGNPSPGIVMADPNQVWYPFIENGTTNLYFFQEGIGSTTYDSSGNNRNCTIGPATQWGTGKYGSGIQVYQQSSGGIRSLICGTAPTLNAFTVEFWINTSADYDGRLVGALGGGGNGGPGNNWLIDYRGRIRLEVWPCPTCGSHGIESNFDLRNSPYRGHWNHVAVSFNGGNQVNFYINGNYDSTKTIPDQSGINTFSLPLEIGAVESQGQITAALGTLRISNIVKTSFPYGQYAFITIEPTIRANDLINPSIVGESDLTIQSLQVYPNQMGGLLIEAVVQNQGTKSTTNGFFTDLYIDHLPNGAGDYEGSLRFWVNDPLHAGATATLTTLIDDPKSLGLQSNTPGEELSWTLFAQTDSTGVIFETDQANNIITSVTDICIAAGDIYEGSDDTFSGVVLIDQNQIHNFDHPGDEDWMKIEALAGKEYAIQTSNLDENADTYLYVYGPDGTTLITSNDDYDATLASRVTWTAEQTGTYYVLVKQWNPNAGGCGTRYTIDIIDYSNNIFIPMISR